MFVKYFYFLYENFIFKWKKKRKKSNINEIVEKER